MVHDNFGRLVTRNNVCHFALGNVLSAVSREKIARRNVGKTNAEIFVVGINARKKIVCTVRKRHIKVRRSGGYNPHNVALYNVFCKRRILHLLADCNLISLFYKACNVALHAVIRHTAHRRFFLLSAVSARERKLQNL